MAQFCPQCGKEVPAGAASCSACEAPKKSSNKALKIILTVIAVLVGLGIVGAGLVIFIFLVLRPHNAASHPTPAATSRNVVTPNELGTEFPEVKPHNITPWLRAMKANEREMTT